MLVVNVQTQIPMFRSALRATSGASDDVRSYDLVWLIHLVGDVHQPLHTTSRFTHEQPKGDAGGTLGGDSLPRMLGRSGRCRIISVGTSTSRNRLSAVEGCCAPRMRTSDASNRTLRSLTVTMATWIGALAVN